MLDRHHHRSNRPTGHRPSSHRRASTLASPSRPNRPPAPHPPDARHHQTPPDHRSAHFVHCPGPYQSTTVCPVRAVHPSCRSGLSPAPNHPAHHPHRHHLLTPRQSQAILPPSTPTPMSSGQSPSSRVIAHARALGLTIAAPHRPYHQHRLAAGSTSRASSSSSSSPSSSIIIIITATAL